VIGVQGVFGSSSTAERLAGRSPFRRGLPIWCGLRGGAGSYRAASSLRRNNAKDDEDPSYSPDGKKIAYTGYKGSSSDDGEDYDHEIYTINVGGGGKSQVTNTTNSFAASPSWGRRP
jgi:dipeptidyl aminopeptidase/acylaminoacyl peptidase